MRRTCAPLCAFHVMTVLPPTLTRREPSGLHLVSYTTLPCPLSTSVGVCGTSERRVTRARQRVLGVFGTFQSKRPPAAAAMTLRHVAPLSIEYSTSTLSLGAIPLQVIVVSLPTTKTSPPFG